MSSARRPSSVSRIARARSASPRCSDFDRSRNTARSAASAVSFDFPGMLGLHSPHPRQTIHSVAHSQAPCLVFARFAEMQSIRQVFLSLRADQIALPYIDSKSSGQHQLLWKPPVYATVNNLLTNPVYAGAYVFGRTGSRVTIE